MGAQQIGAMEYTSHIPRILLIDDDMIFCKTIEKIGRQLNVSVQAISDIEEISSIELKK